MILDDVLYESDSFDRDDMVDMFTEGFLFALEMQEAGYKAGNTEELSEAIAEGANVAISEISDDLKRKAAARALVKAKMTGAYADSYANKAHALAHSADYNPNRSKDIKQHMDSAKKFYRDSNKRMAQFSRINQKIKDKNKRI